MPPYVPIADEVTIPVLSTLAGTAQADFVALKRKINNLFYESGHYYPLRLHTINSGVIHQLFLPPSTEPGIMYGYATHITRNDDTPATSPLGSGVGAVGLQTSIIAGDNVNNPGLYIFGAALEAWSSPINSHALLIGLESSIISQYSDNLAGLVGFDIVYKNRPDKFRSLVILATECLEHVPYIIKTSGTTNWIAMGSTSNAVGTVFRMALPDGTGNGDGTCQASTVQGIGANHYNRNSRAMQITSQDSSGSGEWSGWHRGITFERNSISPALIAGVVVPGIVISMVNMGNPLNVGAPNNPWIAYPHSSALALSEYMSVTWDKDQNIRMYCDSFYHTMWFIATDGSQAVDVTKRFGYNYSTNRLVINSGLSGPPAPANDSVQIEVGGTLCYVHVTH